MYPYEMARMLVADRHAQLEQEAAVRRLRRSPRARLGWFRRSAATVASALTRSSRPADRRGPAAGTVVPAASAFAPAPAPELGTVS